MTFANGVESHAHGWRDESAPDRWIVMFGVGSTAPVGPARIDVVTTGSDGSAQSSGHDLVVASGAFRSERIALNSPMTQLRASDDPVKTTQSERLWSVLQTTDLDVRYHRAPFVIPVPTVRITSRYGDRRVFAYSDGREARSIHYGVDFAAPTGTPISAPGAGRVVMAEDRILTGYTIVLEHLPGVYSMYYHLDELAVAEGAEVPQGDLLGTVGSTGLSTGPHLHWEIRVSGVPVDPFLFVDTHPVPTATAPGGAVEQQNATLDRPDGGEASSAVRSGEGG
jgi:murein DD-endopeptidase MepM/ murein hydrolase activator NlpD